jgi:hypothetical protein
VSEKSMTRQQERLIGLAKMSRRNPATPLGRALVSLDDDVGCLEQNKGWMICVNCGCTAKVLYGNGASCPEVREGLRGESK